MSMSSVDYVIKRLLECSDEVGKRVGEHMAEARRYMLNAPDEESQTYWHGKLIGMYEMVMIGGREYW